MLGNLVFFLFWLIIIIFFIYSIVKIAVKHAIRESLDEIGEVIKHATKTSLNEHEWNKENK